MPDYPPIQGLQQAVERKILPQKAGDLSPVTMRAVEGLRQMYPADMYSTQVTELPLTHPDAFSNVLGETDVDLSPLHIPNTQSPEEIRLNPALGMGFGQAEVAHTLSHELQHVRQGRTDDPLARLKQFTMPYSERPDEVSAEKVADADFLKLPHAKKVGPTVSDRLEIVHGLGSMFLKP